MRVFRTFAQGLGLVGLAWLSGCASPLPPPASRGEPPPIASAPPAEAVAPAPAPPTPSAPPRVAEPVPTDAELLAKPEPEPRVEPVRPGGPNKPYQVAGETYAPQLGDLPVQERGIASWYGRPFHGRKTASGEVFDMYGFSAAHKTLPIPSYVRVRNPANGREVIVRVNDRGPFIAGRVIDLSYAAAVKLGVRGLAPVELSRITHEDIHTGAWRGAVADSVVAVAATGRDLAAAGGPPPRTNIPAATGTPAHPTAVVAPAAASAASAAAVAVAVAEPGAPHNPAPVRPQAAFTQAARGFWLQLGAFAQGDGAAGLRRRVEQQVEWLAPLLTVFNDAGLHRLQAGPYPSRKDAQGAADRLRHALQLVPLVLERR